MAASSVVITVATDVGPLELDLVRAAVVVVDMQNDFGHPDGMFARAGVDISGIQAVVGPTATVLAAARGAGLKVVYLKMAYRPDLSDAGRPDGPSRIKQAPMGVGEPISAPDGTTGRILVRDTWNTDILDELAPEPGDSVVYKHRFSGFYETELDDVLRRSGITDLIFTGCTTSVCVESTMRDAMFRDYRCVLLADCTAEPISRSNHDASITLLGSVFGWVCQSRDLLANLNQPALVTNA